MGEPQPAVVCLPKVVLDIESGLGERGEVQSLCSASLGSANRPMPECGCDVASATKDEATGARSLNWLVDLSAT